MRYRYNHLEAMLRHVDKDKHQFFVCPQCEGTGELELKRTKPPCWKCYGKGYDPEYIRSTEFVVLHRRQIRKHALPLAA